MIKKAAVVVVSGLILIVAVAFFIYPTQYKYFQYDSGNSKTDIRVNILTGKVEYLDFKDGWSSAQ